MQTREATHETREIARFMRHQRLKSDRRRFDVAAARRHVPHLTQSELAELAGISEVSISQIETSRYPNLNTSILRRLCRALRLPEASETYVVRLLDQPSGSAPLTNALPDWVTAIVDQAEPNPAVLVNPRLDILYWNGGAARMLGDFGQVPPDMRNVVMSMFRAPEARQAWVEWGDYVANLVAGVKMQYSQVPDFRARIMSLVDDLYATDPDFARLWQQVDPIINPSPKKELIHPVVGRLRLYQTVSHVVNEPHLLLIQFAPRDAETAAALARLRETAGLA